MSDKNRNPRRSADQWQAIVEQQMQSGLSGAAFCKAEGLIYQSFMNWRKKLEPVPEPIQSNPQFVELTTPDANPTSHAPQQSSPWIVELDLAPGVQLRIAL